MTSVHGAVPGRVRWGMLAVISLGIIALTLNWFDVATAFPLIFGHLVAHTSFDTGWIFLAVVSAAFALLGLAGRNPASGR